MNELQGALTWRDRSGPRAPRDRVDRLTDCQINPPARLEERKDCYVDFSQLVERGLPQHRPSGNKKACIMSADIQEASACRGCPDDLYELVSTSGNARKYCDPQGTVRLQLAATALLAEKVGADRLQRLCRGGQGQDYRLSSMHELTNLHPRSGEPRQTQTRRQLEGQARPRLRHRSVHGPKHWSAHRGKISVHHKDGSTALGSSKRLLRLLGYYMRDDKAK